MGRLFFIRNQYDLAISYFEVAEGIAEQIRDYHLVGRAWGYHSFMLCRLGMLAEADHGPTVTEQGRRMDSSPMVGSGMISLADVAAERGEFDKAITLADDCADIGRKTDSKRMLARALFFSARVLVRKKDYIAAESAYLQAMALSASWGERQYVANDKLGLALICAETGRPAMAGSYRTLRPGTYDLLGLFQQRDEADKFLKVLTQPDYGGRDMTLKPWYQVVYPQRRPRENRPWTRPSSPSTSTRCAIATCRATTRTRPASSAAPT